MPEPPPLGSFTLPKWRVFESWCLAHAVDPVNCPVGPVLDQQGNSIAARRELDEIPQGRHRMVSAFMRGVRRLRPVRPIGVPSWDLSIVLEGLMAAPFEPLESAPEQILTLKFMFLLALARFYPHSFALKWSHFTIFILPLLQVRMRGFTCSVLSEL